MKAIVKQEGKRGVTMIDVPLPIVSDKDVLIKVRKSAICGTDVGIYLWNAWAQKNVPLGTIIGHEFVGEVAKVGKGVQNIKIGDRVSAEGHIVCNHCRSCLQGKKHLCPATRGIGYHKNGCFAEFISLPEENIFPIPKEIPDDLAAIFDPFGNATHTALSFDLVGEDVLITGAGPIGMMAAAIARHAGARYVVVTDINDYRLNLAKKLGATHAVNVSRTSLKEAMQGTSIQFTVGLEMSGHPEAFVTLLESMEPGAHVGLLGTLPPNTLIDWDLVIFKLLNIKGIWGREIFATWYKMTHMLQAGLDIAPVITHRFPADEYEAAFQTMMQGNSGKIILDWESR